MSTISPEMKVFLVGSDLGHLVSRAVIDVVDRIHWYAFENVAIFGWVWASQKGTCMTRFFVLAGFTVVLAGCGTPSPVPQGGEGQTNRGDTLIAEAKLGFDGNNEVIISSAKGWSCKGAYSVLAAGNSTSRQFPLSCSNGATGNALMSVNSVQQRATVAFTLSNGEAGRVAFGVVS